MSVCRQPRALIVRLLLLLPPLLSRANGEAGLSLPAAVDWSSFLARADMIWEHDNHSLPTSWTEAAFTGNGLLSIAAVYQPSGNVVQFELGRSDVWACGKMPMLPIGALEWSLPAPVARGRWRLSLHDAVVSGNISLADGSSVWFRFWTAATAQVNVLEYGVAEAALGSGSAGDARFVPKLPLGRGMVGPIGPAAECHNRTDATGTTSVCSQQLTVDNQGRPQECGSFATAISAQQLEGGAGNRVLVSVANSQPAAQQYPPPSATQPPEDEAAAAVQLSVADIRTLWSDHITWWHQFYLASMVSVPDTHIESYLAIQNYKLGSATRRHGTPIMSLVGPFRMDAIERCPAEPSVRCRVNCPPGMTNKSIPVYGSAWLGLWFDYNVEMAYWPCFVSGHADLAMSLAHGLRAGAAAMTANTLSVSGGIYNDSMGIVAGAGLNLEQLGQIGVPGCLKPNEIHDYRHRRVTSAPSSSGAPGAGECKCPTCCRGQTTDGLPFSSHTIWSSCAYRGNFTCIREELLPLLLPALRWYNHFLTTNGTDDEVLHLPPTHSSGEMKPMRGCLTCDPCQNVIACVRVCTCCVCRRLSWAGWLGLHFGYLAAGLGLPCGAHSSCCCSDNQHDIRCAWRCGHDVSGYRCKSDGASHGSKDRLTRGLRRHSFRNTSPLYRPHVSVLPAAHMDARHA